jgi:hypothetical protein
VWSFEMLGGYDDKGVICVKLGPGGWVECTVTNSLWYSQGIRLMLVEIERVIKLVGACSIHI